MLKQHVREAKSVRLPKPKEELSSSAQQPHAGARVRSRGPIQSPADVLVVVLELPTK
jgi:hypothetical protein